MRIEDHLEALTRSGLRLADAAERAGLEADVPACPGWQVRELVGHTGGVHRWAASFVTTGRAEPFPKDEEDTFFAAPADGLIDWFRDGHRRLVGTLEAADPDVDCWTFLPAPSPLAFWARRQAHETTIHSIDAGAVEDVDPALATDGVDELLTGFFSRLRRRHAEDPPLRIDLRTSDTGRAWNVLVRRGRCELVEDQPAPAMITGRAADLYRLLWNRGGLDQIEIAGDRSVLDQWRARMRITWN